MAPRRGYSTSGLRRMAAPFVVGLPSGVSTRDRLRLNEVEAAALADIGQHLGRLYRSDYRVRALEGRHVTAKDKAASRRERKRALTSESSSRWAGTITRASEDQFNVGMRGLAAEQSMLRRAIAAIETRLALTPGEAIQPSTHGMNRAKPVRGYRDKSEWFEKSRRAAVLRQRLDVVSSRVEAANPRLVHGGNRLWRNRSNLADSRSTVDRWRHEWDAKRMFLTADGETGKKFGNQTIRVTPDGYVSIKVPTPLVAKYGSHLHIEAPLNMSTHRAEEWRDRIVGNRAVGYTITLDTTRGAAKSRWHITAAWTYPSVDLPSIETLRQSRTLGVDVNDGHLAAYVLDPSGNPVGEPLTFAVEWKDLPATTRDGHLRHVITQLLHAARNTGCASITIEDLDFADARTTGRETMGRGSNGKRFRRTVAGIPTGQFRNRLKAMAAEAGIFVIAVDPAYTSRWGDDHWRTPLNARRGFTKTSGPITRHHAAAVVIGRRGYGLSARRTSTAPPQRQRTLPGPALDKSRQAHHRGGHDTPMPHRGVATLTPYGNKPDRATGHKKATATAQHRAGQ